MDGRVDGQTDLHHIDGTVGDGSGPEMLEEVASLHAAKLKIWKEGGSEFEG